MKYIVIEKLWLAGKILIISLWQELELFYRIIIGTFNGLVNESCCISNLPHI